MERLHAPNEFFRVRGPRDGMLAWEELRRLLADGPHPLTSGHVGRFVLQSSQYIGMTGDPDRAGRPAGANLSTSLRSSFSACRAEA
ncbi:MAG TPA: hypothetical protein VGL39_01890 [Jatrophihabitantaceae bacterium]|jgi:hypothetical protein